MNNHIINFTMTNKPGDEFNPSPSRPEGVRILTTDEVYAALQKMEDKYQTLVWYARKPAYADVDEKFKDRPEDVRTGCKQAIIRAQEQFPSECRQLHMENSDWVHGFNSGCLAAFRFALHSLFLDLNVPPDDWEEGFYGWMGGPDEAQELFPSLDT